MYYHLQKSPQKGKQIDVDGLEKMGSNPVSIMRVRTYFALIGKGIGLNAINPAVLIYWIGASTYATEQLQIEGVNLIYYFSATLLPITKSMTPSTYPLMLKRTSMLFFQISQKIVKIVFTS